MPPAYMRSIYLEAEEASGGEDFKSTADAAESSEEHLAESLVYSDKFKNGKSVEVHGCTKDHRCHRCFKCVIHASPLRTKWAYKRIKTSLEKQIVNQ